jgi:hypothetical protein
MLFKQSRMVPQGGEDVTFAIFPWEYFSIGAAFNKAFCNRQLRLGNMSQHGHLVTANPFRRGASPGENPFPLRLGDFPRAAVYEVWFRLYVYEKF